MEERLNCTSFNRKEQSKLLSQEEATKVGKSDVVTHTCHPSYSEGQDHSSRPAWAKVLGSHLNKQARHSGSHL
jgi:hypothetical protein